ncbi:KAP family NTPase [Georgenia daeguensis]|uniref:KAP family NTPase n=2 Tax=Georgenia daeguensis TaxID=908355 RepID=A0ABP6UQJ0_9MICO
MITTYLTEFENSRWQVVPFTPWATSGTEGLLSEFFAALATVIPEPGSKKDLRGLISSYADIARPLAALIPVAGAAVVEATRALETRLAKPWNVAFDEIAAELRTLGVPVLVVVDDIDRLQPRELLDLLKVVRLLGRFPGVDFLLAYDEQTLIETLQNPGQASVSKARARAFMEKIVQYPLSIPPLLTGQIVRMLNAGLTEIVTPERVETGFDKHRFGDIILSTMPSQLATPRAIERFLAQVREQFRVHDLSEMNDVDLILAVFLKVQFPDVFAGLQSWKVELTRSTPSFVSFAQREDKQPEWDRLVGVLDRDEDRRDALAVLAALFPAVRGPNPLRAGAGRFAHPDYFDRYLAQAIPEGDIPDAVVTRAIEKAAAGESTDLRALVSAEDDAQVTLVLSKLRARYPDIREVPHHEGPTGPVTLELLTAGMTLVDEAEDRLDSWTSTGLQLTRWTAILLRRLLDADPASDVDRALTACSNVHRRAHVISTAMREVHGLKEETQRALCESLQREARRLLPFLLADLRQGDQSTGESGSSFLYGLVAESPALAELQAQIATGLATQEFTLEDVAARFVGLAYVIGGSGRPSSASFAGDLFTKITGVEARSGERRDMGEWPDSSWPRRKELAAQFVTPGVPIATPGKANAVESPDR